MSGIHLPNGIQTCVNPNANRDLNTPPPPEQSVPKTSTPRQKPLVVKLEGRDCLYEMDILAPIATVGYCDVDDNLLMIHQERSLNEVVGVFVWDGIQLGRAEMSKFKALKYIVKLGPGLKNVDVMAAGEMGIAVSHVTGFGIEDAADSTLSMILELYSKPSAVPLENNASTVSVLVGSGTRIRGQTLGLIGFGSVGRAVSIRAKVLGFKVIFYDPYIRDCNIYGVTRVNQLDDLLAKSDCVSLHCSVNEENIKMINDATIQLMRPGIRFVNISDGELIDETALATALHNGRIGAAALDLYTKESNEGILSNAPNILRTPGTAFLSDRSLKEFWEAAAWEMRAFLEDGVMSPLLWYLKNGKFFGIENMFHVCPLKRKHTSF
ncbi:unnamed protein product [Orchesella dallaii]|uniref:C-terminal-binding protein n=1 Tax=Orchesella dallaii TaxID=48710 RepID=A0ABP1RKK2_9HEXA